MKWGGGWRRDGAGRGGGKWRSREEEVRPCGSEDKVTNTNSGRLVVSKQSAMFFLVRVFCVGLEPEGARSPEPGARQAAVVLAW